MFARSCMLGTGNLFRSCDMFIHMITCKSRSRALPQRRCASQHAAQGHALSIRAVAAQLLYKSRRQISFSKAEARAGTCQRRTAGCVWPEVKYAFTFPALPTNHLLDLVRAARSESIPRNDLEKCTGHQHAFLDKQSRAGHALQFTHVRRLLCSRCKHVLEHAFLERAEIFPRGRKLRFLWRMEPAICRAALFHDGNGFLARQTNCYG